MTNEELNQKLYEKCDREFDAFIDEMNQAFQDKANGKYKLDHGDEFLSEYAYQYTVYGDILMALEDMNLSDEQCQALLDSPNPLFTIYDEWLGTETGCKILQRVWLTTVSGRLGHSNPNTTLKVYSHMFRARDRAAAETLGAIAFTASGA